MQNMSTENELPAEIAKFVEREGHGRLVKADRRPGGGRREAWFVDLELEDGSVDELFLRLDRKSTSDEEDPYSTLRETDVYLALQETTIPVPRIHGVHRSPQAVLSDRTLGETWFSRLQDPDERISVAQDFIRYLAALHRLDPASLDIPALGPLKSARECALQEIDAWQALYDVHDPHRDPLIEFTFHWLRRNVPDYDGPVVLVQGDTGPGNFLYQDGKVTAILDWELSHWSDPMDDIAWLSLRSVQEPFTHFPDRLKEYSELSGIEIDEARVRFYRVMAELRIVIMGHARNVVRSGEGEIGNGLIYGALHHRLQVETLADVLGLSLEPVPLPDVEPTEREWLYEAALAQIRDVLVPRSSDPFVIARAKGLARVFKHLRDADRLAPRFDEQELDDLEELLGARPATIASGRDALTRRIEKGDLSDRDIVRYFHRNTTRRTELARSSSGALADRHYPELF
jgi:aminoglycoside phosphotransferase (APT) family kinase protein